MGNIPLSELFQVKGRFRRSVHLERDFYTENALDGYVLTATAREMLSRVISTLGSETTSKGLVAHRSLRVGKIGIRAFRREAARRSRYFHNPTGFRSVKTRRYQTI